MKASPRRKRRDAAARKCHRSEDSSRSCIPTADATRPIKYEGKRKPPPHAHGRVADPCGEAAVNEEASVCAGGQSAAASSRGRALSNARSLEAEDEKFATWLIERCCLERDAAERRRPVLCIGGKERLLSRRLVSDIVRAPLVASWEECIRSLLALRSCHAHSGCCLPGCRSHYVRLRPELTYEGMKTFLCMRGGFMTAWRG